MISKDFELTILESIIFNKIYATKVIPTIDSEIFEDRANKFFFDVVKKYYELYNSVPNNNVVMTLEIQNNKSLSQAEYKEIIDLVKKIYTTDYDSLKYEDAWLYDTTQKYAIIRSSLNAIAASIDIIDSQKNVEQIPEMLKSAISINLDPDLGHSYVDDAEKRFESYHERENKMPMSLSWINEVANGGFPKKTLIVPVAPTGVGKTLYLCSETAYQLTQGSNVLYISFEMSENRIAQRIDANLMDYDVSKLTELPLSALKNKFNSLKSKILGRLRIKEFGAKTITANGILAICKELEFRENFKPDFIMVDYLNIVKCTRESSLTSDYQINKAVAEELRNVAVLLNAIVIAPTQTNRDGQGAADFGLTEVSESHGISMTADFMFGLISQPELEEANKIKFKQLKNRFGDLNHKSIGIIGINRSKMKLFDLETVGQVNSAPVNLATKQRQSTLQNIDQDTNTPKRRFGNLTI